MKRFMIDHVPLGVNLLNECMWILFGWGFSIVFSFIRFYAVLGRNINMLERWENEIVRTHMMPDFSKILFGSMAGFWVMIGCMGALAAYHYYYHYNGSKSIYLMKRIVNPLELHRRCLALPVLVTGITLVIMFLLVCAYYRLYMAAVPGKFLAPGQWEKIWRW